MARVGPAARLIVQSYEQAADAGNGGRTHQTDAPHARPLIDPGLRRSAFHDPGREMYLRANPQIQGVSPWPKKPRRLRNRS